MFCTKKAKRKVIKFKIHQCSRDHVICSRVKNVTFQKCHTANKIIRDKCETNHCIVRLAEYRFVFKKIDINGIRSKDRF